MRRFNRKCYNFGVFRITTTVHASFVLVQIFTIAIIWNLWIKYFIFLSHNLTCDLKFGPENLLYWQPASTLKEKPLIKGLIFPIWYSQLRLTWIIPIDWILCFTIVEVRCQTIALDLRILMESKILSKKNVVCLKNTPKRKNASKRKMQIKPLLLKRPKCKPLGNSTNYLTRSVWLLVMEELNVGPSDRPYTFMKFIYWFWSFAYFF